MRKIKLMALALGLAATAMMQPSPGAATTTCEQRCLEQYRQCQIICSKNPCIVSCEYNYNICLNNCGSES